ncbi:trp operon repressor [Oxalobacteraceae bacterium OTU3CAMAD1]|nr:trp operon repressor [Oxalobacteraceae bacterium OTU3CAMAD1]
MNRVRTLAEMLASEQVQQKFIVPQLIPAATTVLINIAPDLDGRLLGQLLAYGAAGGKTFMSFGQAKETRVCYCTSRNNDLPDTKRFALIGMRDPYPSSQERARKNLHIYRRRAEAPIFLNSVHDQGEFIKAIPHSVELIIIDDLASWLKYGRTLDATESGDVLAFFKKLNARGIAVVALDSKPKRNSLIAETVALSEPANVIWLTPDPGAPREYGGGFNIVRQKRDDEDSAPTTIQFWWKVVSGNLDFGWEFRDQLDPKAAKRVQIMERQMKVDQLLSEGMSQREIAIQLEVDAATISRDAAALKQKDVSIDALTPHRPTEPSSPPKSASSIAANGNQSS